MAFAFLVTACGEDDESTADDKDEDVDLTQTAVPELRISPYTGVDWATAVRYNTGGDIKQGDSVFFDISLYAEAGIARFYIEDDFQTTEELGLEEGDKSLDYLVRTTTAGVPVGTNVEIQFVLVDRIDRGDTVRTSFNIVSALDSQPLLDKSWSVVTSSITYNNGEAFDGDWSDLVIRFNDTGSFTSSGLPAEGGANNADNAFDPVWPKSGLWTLETDENGEPIITRENGATNEVIILSVSELNESALTVSFTVPERAESNLSIAGDWTFSFTAP